MLNEKNAYVALLFCYFFPKPSKDKSTEHNAIQGENPSVEVPAVVDAIQGEQPPDVLQPKKKQPLPKVSE